MKRVWAGCVVVLAALALLSCGLRHCFRATEPGESFDVFTLQGNDIAYRPLPGSHNDLKALGVMDPNATTWTEPELTAEDLGEVIGTVGWSGERDLTGCTVYRWAKYPDNERVCILDDHGAYLPYWESGTIHPPNGTGLPVEEVGIEVLAVPGILRGAAALPEKSREILLDLDGDGVEERLIVRREDAPVYGDAMGSGDLPYWSHDPLWVILEEAKSGVRALEFPSSAFLAALEERLELETVSGQTILRLEGRLTNPTALLEQQEAGEVLEAGLVDPWIVDASAAGQMGFAAELRVKTERTVLTVGSFDGRIGYENGVFTLSDWTLSGAPLR